MIYSARGGTGGDDSFTPAERIAVFDNDGTQLHGFNLLAFGGPHRAESTLEAIVAVKLGGQDTALSDRPRTACFQQTRTSAVSRGWLGYPGRPEVAMPHGLELESHHRNFASAIEQMNCGLIGRDKSGTIVFANEILVGWLGYDSDELVGLSMEKLIPEELDARIHEQLRAIEAGDIRARITIAQRKDFTTFPILLIPHRYTGPDGPFFNVVIELSTVQTAKPVGSNQSVTVRSSLERIALELQTIGLASEMIAPPVVPLDHPDLASLTDREREVLVHLVAGQRVPAIATELHISQHTVRNHLKSTYRQLGVGNQSELIERVRSLDDPKS